MRNALKLLIIPFFSIGSYRHLLSSFVVRDIKGRFVGSYAGNLWVLINPLATIVTYLFIFSIVLRVQVSPGETGTGNFTIYFLSGFFPWFMFAESLSRSVVVLLENANLITKVFFPVELLPVGVVISSFLINGVGYLCFLIVLAFLGYLGGTWLHLLLLLFLQTLFTWGLANLLSGLCVFIRDMKEILAILLMVWFYACPIVYPASMLPDVFRSAMQFNPMWGFVDLYRDVLLKHQMDMGQLVYVTAVSLIAYSIGTTFFMRAKNAFGDVL
ncbi:MAG: ABC transporter permease [Desulfobacterales bacterium]|nr:ABC transporter permease [Desulfobacterales bacterium]